MLLLALLLISVAMSCGEMIGTTLPPAQILARNTTSHELLTVLVLGSGGLVGTALVKELRHQGYNVLEAKNRLHLDLRIKKSMSTFDSTKSISFCFFLACEVGGSKFIASGSHEKAIWDYNVAMYDNVLPYLENRKIPYIFSSSQLAVTATAYGKVKARGEELVSASQYGKFLRFWNVFGAEKIGGKSHIIGDWIYQCVKFGHVASHTTGWEQRQFVHTQDMALGLIDLMVNYEKLPRQIDITSGEWVTMRHIASIVQQHAKHGCVFQFSDKNSSNMIGMEPANLWKVASDLHEHIGDMFRYYQGFVLKETHPRQFAPYLSFIMCTTNDNYNDIRGRTFNAITTLAASAEAAHLSYELIIVQYNPQITTNYWAGKGFAKNASYDSDLPFSQLFPWVSRRSFGNLRIITVPPSLHRWPEKGKVWEYIGKNVGAVRAHGQFLVLTNPDNIFPVSMIEQLSKQQLNQKIYRAGIVVNFKQTSQVQNLTRACNDLSSAITAPPPNPYSTCSYVPNPSSGQTEQFRTANYAELNGGVPDVNYVMMGDFLIFPRDIFLNSQGYVEVPQNTHVESGQLHALSIKSSASLCYFLDYLVCHQDHTRNGRPEATLGGMQIAALHASRTDAASFGLQLYDLPDAYMYDVFSSAYNPEDPFRTYHHHHLFSMFRKVMWQGKLKEDFVIDFLGIKTSYQYDCGDVDVYRYFHLSRRIPCARHDEFFNRRYNESGYQIMGDLPIVDEEYFEYISLLKAVSMSHVQRNDIPFVVLEFGARYGTWSVRGGSAMRALQPHRPLQIMAVEADEVSFQWLQHHLRENGLASVTKTVKGFVSATSNAAVQFKGWERDSPENTTVASFTLPELLEGYEHVDIIHCDIQGAERVFLDHIPLLTKRVKAIHFGTHNDNVHGKLRATFLANGWTVNQDVAGNGGRRPGRVDHTAFGPVRILWDGILAVENPALLE